MPKDTRKKRSPIWNFFDRMDVSTAKCQKCLALLSITGGSMHNLKRHLDSKHPGVYDSRITSVRRNTNLASSDTDATTSTSPTISNSTLISTATPSTSTATSHLLLQPSTTSSSLSSTPIVTAIKKTQKSVLNHFKKPLPVSKSKLIDRQLVKMIAKEYHPFSIVEDINFKKLLEMLNPDYNLPSKKTISTSLLPQIYNEIKQKVTLEMQTCSAAALRVDGWTSVSCQSYLAITALYITEDNLELQSYLLDCLECSEHRHTAEYLNNEIKRVVNDWGLENKVVAIVSDHAANITSAIRLGNWEHIGCFVHELNLIVQNALEPIYPIRSKIKSIVEYFKRNIQASEELKEVQQEMNLPEIKLKQDVITRWNSTYIMFKRYLELQNAVAYTLPQFNPNLSLPSEEELDTIEKISNILQIFEDITIEISSEKNVTLSKVKVFVIALKKFIFNKVKENSAEGTIRDVLKIITEQFKKRFNFENIPSSHLYYEASLLDPRFKKLAFTENENTNKIIECAAEKATNFNLTPITEPVIVTTSKVSNSLWAEFDEIASKVAISGNTSAGLVEMNQYLLEPILGRNMDPLLWWKEKKTLYPHLFQLAKRRLCIPGTSVPCERIFSKAGQTLTNRRSQLSSNKVQQILFLNSNM